MPWRIERRNNQYCVIKETDNATVACHKTRSKALRHQRALYASEPSLKASGAANYAARAGETIRGNLVRGADGKFSSGGGKPSPKPKPMVKPPRRSSRGRSGGKPKKTDEQRAAEAEAKRQQREQEKKQEQRENRKKVGEEAGLGKNLSDALLEFSSPDEKIQLAPQNAAELEKKGLIEKDSNGEYRMTASGRAYVSAANSGDVRRAADAISEGSDRTREREIRAQEREQRRQEREQRRQERERRRQEREARRGRRRGSSGDSGGQSAIQQGMQNIGSQARGKEAASSFTVFKDATGRWRWVAFSSNGYRDRDGEIVSTKALEDDCLRADIDGDYGPLRWWHVQGLDIGDCDYNAMHGRVLIESGTFREDWIAEKIKAAAPKLEMSIGFMHPIEEPDIEKVFNKIRRFERSLTPKGKASNTFTRFFVQEATKMVKEKLEALKNLLGVNDDQAAAIIAQAEMTEKAAQDAGVAYKAAEEEIAVEEMAEVPADELELDLETAPVVDDGMVYVGDMTPDAFRGLLAEAFQAALEPLVGALNFETKMRGMFDELKGTFGQMSAKKDAEIAEQTERISTLEATQKEAAAIQQALAENLKELTGDQPRAEKRGYRPSQDPATATTEKSAAPTPDASFNDFVENFLKAA